VKTANRATQKQARMLLSHNAMQR